MIDQLQVKWRMHDFVRIAYSKKSNQPVALIITPYYTLVWFDSDGFLHQRPFRKLCQAREHFYQNGVDNVEAQRAIVEYAKQDMPQWIRKKIEATIQF